MRRRTFLAGLAATAIAGVGAACSSGAGGRGERLQMVESLTNPDRTAVLNEILDQFSAQGGPQVQLVSPPTEQADAKIQQMLQSGTGVDVLEVRDITVGAYSNNGYLHDLRPALDSWDGWDDLTENAKSYAVTPQGQSWYVPYGFYGLSLFYRKDLIQEAGFDAPPRTWTELLEQASAIQDPSQNRFGYAFRGGTQAQSNVVAVIEAYVGDQLDVDNAFNTIDGRTIFATEEAQEALDVYFEIFHRASPPSSVAWGYPEMVEGFNNGSTAFLLQDPEVIATINSSQSITPDQWDTAPLLQGPTGKSAQPIASAGWGVAASSGNIDDSVALVEYLSGPASTEFAKRNSLVPIRTEAQSDPFYSTGPWVSYVTMTDDPETWLNVTQPRGVAWWSEWQQKADAEVQQVLIGDLTSAELLRSWDEYWTEKQQG